MISARNLVVGYQGKGLLPSLSLEINQGEIWALVGRNGSGKTTLLRTLVGLLPPVAGEVRRDGGLGVGYVAQRNDLDLSVPYRVKDLVAGGLDSHFTFLVPGFVFRRRAERQASIAQALEECDLLGMENQAFAELSEGQKQRVLMARAIVGNPSLLVLDEPTSAMDIVAEKATFDLILNLQASRGLAVLLVTHQLSALGRLGSHGVYVDRDDGEAVVGGLQDILKSPSFRHRYRLGDAHGG